MAQFDLVSLAEVKTWLGITNTDATRDALLSQLITQISRAIFNNINRNNLLPQTVTETYDGSGHSRLQLRNWPALSVSSVTVDTATYAVSTSVSTPGFFLEPPDTEPPGNMQLLHLRYCRFTKGWQNVSVTYTIGYMVSGEVQSIPSSGPYQITAFAPYGNWGSDYSVSFTGGAALTAVTGVPSTGQYSVSSGVYTFSVDDAGESISLSYGYIPADLTQCALEWIAYRYSQRDRIGQTSKSIGGQETVAYTNEAVPAFVDESLRNFRRTVPC